MSGEVIVTPIESLESLEAEVDKFLDSLNGQTGNDIVALLARVRALVAKLDAALPLTPPDVEE